MTNIFRKFYPWQKSINENRTMVNFWLRVSSGHLIKPSVYSSLETVLNPFLSLGGASDSNKLILSVKDLYDKLKLLKGNGTGDYLEFDKGKFPLTPFLSIATGLGRPFDALSLQSPVSLFDLKDVNSILEATPSECLHSSYLVDSEYIHLQKQVDKNQYRYTGGLKRDKSWSDKDRVIVKGRAGLMAAIPNNSGHLETGAAHFWFGDLIYNDIPKERILSFDQAHEIRELPNGIIYVNLYEGTFNGNLPENQAKQEAFKEHLGLIQK